MCRVLVVEDEQRLMRGMVNMLRDDGYDVAGVATGHGAIDTVARVCIDVVLLDLGLPDMDGMDTLRHLRANTVTDVAVVVLTGSPSRRADVARADPSAIYLIKPALKPSVLAAVHEAAEARANRLMTEIGTDPKIPDLRKRLDDTVRFIREQKRAGGHGGRSG